MGKIQWWLVAGIAVAMASLIAAGVGTRGLGLGVAEAQDAGEPRVTIGVSGRGEAQEVAGQRWPGMGLVTTAATGQETRVEAARRAELAFLGIVAQANEQKVAVSDLLRPALNEFVQRDTELRHWQLHELKVEPVTEKLSGTAAEAVFHVERIYLLGYARPELVPALKGRLAFLEENKEKLSPAQIRAVQEDIEMWKRDLAEYISVPQYSSDLLKVTGEIRDGSLVPGSVRIYRAGALDDWEPASLEDIPTPEQVMKEAFAAAERIALAAIEVPAITVTLDGQKLSFDVAPVLEGSRVLVPFRTVFEALGAAVDWDGTTGTVTAVRGSDTVKLTVGKKLAYKNASEVELDVPAQVVKGRALVPVRFVAEALGAEVEWNAQSRAVTIRVSQENEADRPRVSADVVVAIGGVPGVASADRQRVTYRALLTNVGAVPLQGWKWEVIVAPEIRSRVIHAEQSINPAPASSSAVWYPGESFMITGYLDLNTEGLSKRDLAAIHPVEFRILGADGREIFRTWDNPGR